VRLHVECLKEVAEAIPFPAFGSMMKGFVPTTRMVVPGWGVNDILIRMCGDG